MVMQTEKNEVLSNSSEVREFTIAGTDNIFETLSSRLYTNPKRAIIRETGVKEAPETEYPPLVTA